MNLSCLELKHFRNYNNLKINFSPGMNIFFGQNAQGKTNLLEAVSLLCLGRSFRTRKDSELIQWGSEAAFIRGTFVDKELEDVIEIGIGEGQKKFKQNGHEVKGTALFSQVPVVSFAPDDLQLIKGGPQLRRDFLDLYLAQLDPAYRVTYYKFYKILQQRNRFLKEVRLVNRELEVWNEQFIDAGLKVICSRIQLIEKIKPYIKAAHEQISLNREALNLDYLSFGSHIIREPDDKKLRELFQNELARVSREEFERKLTLVGPQRDDLKITIGDQMDIRNYGSQGQQRTAALALKLGMIDILKDVREMPPLLLLDDVMSEFDNDRKQALLSLLLSSSQTFLTSTGRSDFPIEASVNTVFYQVIKGAVIHES
ncbi:MAG TPA: DNA replication/repair protein RecF [Bacillota bacterium]|nr:DNA replication/repair protein RecF [Bacillota bacterium]